MSQPSGWKQDTRLDLRHFYQVGSTVLVSSHHISLGHNTQARRKILDWLYVIASQARSSILVTPHLLDLRDRNKVGSKILVLLYVTTIKLEAGY
jgi:hypothetical protein